MIPVRVLRRTVSSFVASPEFSQRLRLYGSTTRLASNMAGNSSTEKMQHVYNVVDSFATLQIPGSGNPAAVVQLPSDFDATHEPTVHWMRVVAREFNLSETAFVWPNQNASKGEQEGNLHYNIRFYSGNGTEVDLCGHATLASASVLLQSQTRNNANASIVFHANKDVLKAVQHIEGKNEVNNAISMQIAMDFPNKSLHELTSPEDINGVESILKSAFKLSNVKKNTLYVGIDEDYGDILVHLTEKAFAQIGYNQDIDIGALTEWEGYNRGVIMCCDNSEDTSDPPIDFCSRWFGPKAGIDEDPVTGSAHCTLGPYFSRKLGRSRVRGKQLSTRGGIVDCVVTEKRVGIIGTAATTMRGSLFM